MAKSKIKLSNGTEVVIEGSPEEIAKIISLYSAPVKAERQPLSEKHASSRDEASETKEDYILTLVNAIKDSDDADAIEQKILDRSSTIDRVLLPLYVSHQDLGNKISLSTTEIAKILAELGAPISSANVSHAVAGSARTYVIGDKIRKRGGKNNAVKYKINRKGVNYLSAIMHGSSN